MKIIAIDPLSIFYILNATVLLLHEIESAYWKEWKILKLPGKISGFLLINLPLILLLFWGLFEISAGTTAGATAVSTTGRIIGIVSGVGGLLPFLIHKAFARRKKSFNLIASNIIIYTNIVTGLATIWFSLGNLL